MVDMGAYVRAAMLLERLTYELEGTRAGGPALSVVHPGNMVPDYGCPVDGDLEGTAVVRIGAITPMGEAGFPSVASRPLDDVAVVEYSVLLEMIVTRCYPGTDDNGMPDVAYLDSAARDAMDDAAAMRRAAACTFDTFIPGVWQPRGPSGNIHGGSLTVTVQADLHCDCATTDVPAIDELVPPLDGDPRFR